MKKLIILTFAIIAGSAGLINAQTDPNYKHQAGKNPDTKFNYYSVGKQEVSATDANYKHQAGAKQSKKSRLTIPSGTGSNANYKRQFPAR